MTASSIPRNSLKPMLATLIDEPFDDSDWIFEIKFDGFRLLAFIEDGNVTLYSRNTINVTEKYPSIAKALSAIKENALIDGELVALDQKGISRFQLLQQALEKPIPLYYYAFDLLFLDGKDFRYEPLLDRKKYLQKILPKKGIIRYSDHVPCDGKKFFKAASRKGLEGMIAKRAAGKYFSGKRTREWLKVKSMRQQETVIVGFTKPRKSRKYFGSLVLAVYEHKKLRYAGHSGGGFDEAMLKSLHAKMTTLRAAKPLQEKIPREADVTWIKPKLVCEVKFTEWTSEEQMRHPVFLGLRTDKPASKVIRERPRKI